MIKGFKKYLVGEKYDFTKALDNGNLTVEIGKLLDQVPEKPPKQTNEEISNNFRKKTQEPLMHFRAFLFQLLEYFEKDKNEDIGNLALHNLKDYCKNLPYLYEGFNLILNFSPDYFNLKELLENEIKLVEKFVDYLELYMKNWKNIPIYNYENQIVKNKELFHKSIINNVKIILKDFNFIISDFVYIDFPLSYLPIYYNVSNPIYPELELEKILINLNDINNAPSFYYFIPIYDNKIFLQGGYRISSTFDMKNYFWETFVPHDLPEEVMKLLPFKEKIVVEDFTFRNELLSNYALIYIWEKQSNFKFGNDDDYFINLLNSDLQNLNHETFKDIKNQFKTFVLNYFKNIDSFQITFPGLNLKEIISFFNNLSKIDDIELFRQNLNVNIKILKSIGKFFGI